MATIITKNSSTASSVPTNAQLVQGELAVNVTDKRLFTKNASGTVVELGTNPSSLTLPNGTANGVAYLNGSKVLTTGSALTFDGTSLGIGTSSPGAKLDVVGTARVSGLITASGSIQTPTDTAELTLGNTVAGNGIGLYYNAASDSAKFYNKTGGVDIMTLTRSGNLGLGVTPSAWLASSKVIQVGAGGVIEGRSNSPQVMRVSGNTYLDSSGIARYIGTGNAMAYEQYLGAHTWYTASSGTAGNAISFTQAMTLDASGNLLVGKTASGFSNVGIQFEPAGGMVASRSGTTNSDATLVAYSTGAAANRFYVGMAGTVFATNTTISAISDIRFKENVRDLDAGLAEVMALKPRLYDWKEGKGANIKNARGFIAQEFEQVFPDLIDEWRDPAPEGEEPYKSVRQDLIPVLVKAIQEQQAIIEQLKSDVAALKAAK